MPENETILYRGASFELGHGPGFYGIWPSGTPRPQSIEWWPDTPDGWQGAWARYNALEVPGSIAMVAPPQQGAGRAGARQLGTGHLGTGHLGTRALLAAGLLAAGIICGLAGLFPAYLNGASLASSASQVIPHVFYLVGWIASLGLILFGGARLKAGVLLGLGLSIVTFGFFFADAGEVIAGGSHLMGAGLALSLIGWAACAAGAITALPLGAGFFRRSVDQFRTTFSPTPVAQAPVGPVGPVGPWTPNPAAPPAAPAAQPSPAAQSSSAAQPSPAAQVTPGTAAPSPSAAPQAPDVPSAAKEEAETADEAAADHPQEPAPAQPGAAEPLPVGAAAAPAPFYSPYGPYTSYGAYQPARTSRWSNPVTRRAILAVTLAVVAALATAITFAPSWDSYTLRTVAGQVHSLTAGNAFSNPGAVIAGDVLVMVALVLVAAAAALWRPVRLGAVLLAGALIPMVAQGVSALAQLGEGVSPSQFGISSGQAQQLGLSISQGLTAWFWLYCVFVAALAVICGWLWAGPRRTSPAVAHAAEIGRASCRERV